MKRSHRYFLVASWILAATICAACSSSSDSDQFAACAADDDCGEALSCVCGVCSQTCQPEQDDCSTLSGNATCASGAALGSACQTEVGASGGVCAERCSSDRNCAALAGGQECRDRACLPSDEPGPGLDEPYDCEANGNCCSTEVENMDGLVGNPDPSENRAIGWEVHNHVELDPGTSLVGTWKGTRSLDAANAVECPANASQLGLPCEVDYVGVFRHKDGRLFEFRIALPRSALDALPTDEAVEIDYNSTPNTPGHRIAMRSTSDDATLLLVDGSGEFYAETMELEYPDFTVRMPGGDARVYETALCITHPDQCDRVFRAESLIIEGEQTYQLGTGESLDFAAGEVSYRAWHVVSFRPIFEDWTMCAAAPPPSSFFAIAPTP